MTATVVVLAVIIHCVPGAADRLELSRGASAVSALWRVFGWQLTHWNGDHLFWDVSAFLCLGGYCELRSRRGMLEALALSAGLVTGCVWFLHPEIPVCRGLSGVDSALFCLALGITVRDGRASGKPWVLAVSVLAGVLFVLKWAFELATMESVFAQADGMVPLAAAHLAGGVSGVLAALGAGVSGPRRCRVAPGRATAPSDQPGIPA